MRIIADYVTELNNINDATLSIETRISSSTPLITTSGTLSLASTTPIGSPFPDLPSQTGAKWIGKFIIIIIIIITGFILLLAFHHFYSIELFDMSFWMDNIVFG